MTYSLEQAYLEFMDNYGGSVAITYGGAQAAWGADQQVGSGVTWRGSGSVAEQHENQHVEGSPGEGKAETVDELPEYDDDNYPAVITDENGVVHKYYPDGTQEATKDGKTYKLCPDGTLTIRERTDGGYKTYIYPPEAYPPRQYQPNEGELYEYRDPVLPIFKRPPGFKIIRTSLSDESHSSFIITPVTDATSGSSAIMSGGVLVGGDGNDTLIGGTGDDLIKGGAGADVLDGGGGIDTLDYYDDFTGVYIDLRTNTALYGQAAGDVISNFENVVGGVGADTIYGSAGANELKGWSSDDIIAGAGGNDTLWGGSGNDRLEGGEDNDVIVPSSGRDTLDGGNGIDTLDSRSLTVRVFVDLKRNYGFFSEVQGYESQISNIENVVGSSYADRVRGNSDANEIDGQGGDDNLSGDDGNDMLWGGAGSDVISGDAGADMLDGGEGIDFLEYSNDETGVYVDLRTGSAAYGHAESDIIRNFENVIGGLGNDTLYGSDEANEINGLSGNDIIDGAGGSDEIFGDEGDDTIYGSGGDDRIYGSENNDVIAGGAGADTLDGGSGIDTLLYGEAEAAYVDLRTGYVAGQATGDVIRGFENVTGGSGNDTLYGSAYANELNGQGGNDTLAGADGNDTLWGSNGNDRLEGGADNDVVSGGVGADTMDGGSGIDTLVYSDYGIDTVLFGGVDGVYVDLRTGATAGQAAGDVISGFENVVGGIGNDTLYGSAEANELNGQGGNDTLAGADGNDTLWGGSEHDWLEGGIGDDLLAGGSGNDRLVGGAGNDVLHGEAGRDLFVFESALNAAGNVDRIADFNVAEDWIALSGSVFGGIGTSVSLVIGTGATANNAAQIVYDNLTGALYYDPDGASPAAQVKFAQLSTGLALTAANFVLI
ncbi:calcium-binding protein [Microvirga sp. Mcv34]|uniref:calcium-binding protein n=1 Tax=Microvirga sp. Mcv34 TaxID=2926016 RepID=UPI0021C6D2F1|nr:hypothetical protein [Microvirga sp. Mcv34]